MNLGRMHGDDWPDGCADGSGADMVSVPSVQARHFNVRA